MWRSVRISPASARTEVFPAPIEPVMMSNSSIRWSLDGATRSHCGPGLRLSRKNLARSDVTTATATYQLQRVSEDISERLGLCAGQCEVDDSSNHADEHAVQNEAGLNASTHPERCQEAGH